MKQACDLQTTRADVYHFWSRINQLKLFSDFPTCITISPFFVFLAHWLLLHPFKYKWNILEQKLWVQWWDGSHSYVHKAKTWSFAAAGRLRRQLRTRTCRRKGGEKKKKSETVCKNNCSWSLHWLPDNWPQTRKHTDSWRRKDKYFSRWT